MRYKNKILEKREGKKQKNVLYGKLFEMQWKTPFKIPGREPLLFWSSLGVKIYMSG